MDIVKGKVSRILAGLQNQGRAGFMMLLHAELCKNMRQVDGQQKTGRFYKRKWEP
jgi:hypothetical protein